MASKLKSYAKLFRLYQAPSQGLLPVIGYLAMGEMGLGMMLGLFTIGILLHIFFAGCNELLDVEHDRRMESLYAHPLASSEVSTGACYAVVFASPMAASAMVILFFPSTLSLLLILLCISLFSYYLLAKRTLPGAEFPLALAFGLIVLFGSSAAGMGSPAKAAFIAAVVATQAAVILTVYRSLWLAQFGPGEDRPTIGSILGANQRGGRFYPSKPYISFTSATQAVFITCAMAPLALGNIAFEDPSERMQAVFLILVLLASVMTTYKAIMSPLYKPGDIRKLATLHYVFGGFVFALILVDTSPLVFIIPVVFFAEVLMASRLAGAVSLPPTFGTRPPTP